MNSGMHMCIWNINTEKCSVDPHCLLYPFTKNNTLSSWNAETIWIWSPLSLRYQNQNEGALPNVMLWLEGDNFSVSGENLLCQQAGGREEWAKSDHLLTELLSCVALLQLKMTSSQSLTYPAKKRHEKHWVSEAVTLAFVVCFILFLQSIKAWLQTLSLFRLCFIYSHALNFIVTKLTLVFRV